MSELWSTEYAVRLTSHVVMLWSVFPCDWGILHFNSWHQWEYTLYYWVAHEENQWMAASIRAIRAVVCSCIQEWGRMTYCNQGPVTHRTVGTVLISFSGQDHIHCAFCWERPGLNGRTVELYGFHNESHLGTVFRFIFMTFNWGTGFGMDHDLTLYRVWK
jgi:hypothetical protein